MSSPKGTEPPIITAIRLARMRDGSLGQADEIQALIDLLKGAEQVLKITNDTVWALIEKRKGMSQEYKKHVFEESFILLTESLEKFVDAKTKRIRKFIDYFHLMAQDVTEEHQKLNDFEKEWDDIKRELSVFKINFLSIPTSRYKEDAIKQANYMKKNVVQTALPILERLTGLENQMQKRVIGMIAFIAKETTPVNTNDLYKLLTGEP